MAVASVSFSFSATMNFSTAELSRKISLYAFSWFMLRSLGTILLLIVEDSDDVVVDDALFWSLQPMANTATIILAVMIFLNMNRLS